MRNPLTRLCLLLMAIIVVAPIVTVTVDAQDAKTSGATLVNLNTATTEQLDRLPGVGPKTAALIIEYRQKNGGFKKVEDLMNVRGIGEKSFLRLRPLITVTPAKLDRAGSDK